MADKDSKKKKVLILGGGFAGVSTAMRLGKLARRRTDIEVDIVSNENYFVFQPMLPEVAAGTLEATHIVNPIRRLCAGCGFHRASVDEIDLDKRTVRIIGSDLTRQQVLHYDHLVIAMGTIVDLRRNPGMAEHSLAMKTLGDAFYLRNEVINKLEQAAIESDPAHRRKLLTFVVVGGGFSGIETVGEINDMIKGALRYYPRIPKEDVRVCLVHSRSRILQELSETLALFAQRKLADRGVELILETRVAEATGDEVIFKGGRSVATKTIICTIGNSPHPVITSLPIANNRGRIDTNEFLQVVTKDKAGEVLGFWDGLWSMGDCAFVPDITKKEDDGSFKLCPPTAQYAIRQGTICANNIWAELNGGDHRPFKFGGLGQMAVIGHMTGVAQVMGWNFSGFPAFFLWRLVYWMKLPGVYAKIRVALDWMIDAVFPKDLTQLNVFRTEKVSRSHYSIGAYIFHQGDIGDSFYVIEKGEVEVVKEEEDGREIHLATLREGDSFGEIALLKKAPRTASIRCMTPVDVISMSRSDFQALASTFRQFREDLYSHIESMMEQNKKKITEIAKQEAHEKETRQPESSRLAELRTSNAFRIKDVVGFKGLEEAAEIRASSAERQGLKAEEAAAKTGEAEKAAAKTGEADGKAAKTGEGDGQAAKTGDEDVKKDSRPFPAPPPTPESSEDTSADSVLEAKPR